LLLLLLLLLRGEVIGLHGEQRGRSGSVLLRTTATVVQGLATSWRSIDDSTIGQNMSEGTSLTEPAATLARKQSVECKQKHMRRQAGTLAKYLHGAFCVMGSMS
jgi:hypothetical protein